ncbi:MAG: hypothetical protein KME64_43885 [Scytonematopsis contorta HA4267-MV1]|jgi:hypothetical protein|nr:hypothetical protein [Scytonematopsis contorta HA4267-MV1]
MFRLIQRVLSRVRGDTLKLLVLAGVILLAWGTLAPVGTLVWWLSEGAEMLGLKKNQIKNLPRGVGSRRQVKKATDNSTYNNTSQSKNINCYIIFLPGVGDFSADELTPGEEIFLDSLVKVHPNCVAVKDVFPYSAANKGLGGQRFLSPLWRAADKADGWFKIADTLIKIRNLWRFAISADERYGSVYNQGIAYAVVERMNAAHPIEETNSQPLKIILIGTSGGAQVALGAASHLHDWLKAQLIVVSVGGAFDGNTGFEEVSHIYHLRGRRDWIEDITGFVFAERWSLTVASPFNQAKQQGRYTIINTGPHAHDGSEGYFGTASVGKSNVTYVELTLQTVNGLPIW